MTAGAPTVYFIDDSATMREVIKIAFRRENINVLPCHDGASALAQMEQLRPDVVISDVIMPDKDGYEVCDYIKRHPDFCHIPVILMSGVVNRAVAEKASAVKADELVRKPFQPQDLIARVKHLLNPRMAPASAPPAAAISASAALSSIFSGATSGGLGTGRALAAPAPRIPSTHALPAERLSFAGQGIAPAAQISASNSNPAAPPALRVAMTSGPAQVPGGSSGNAMPAGPLPRTAPATLPAAGNVSVEPQKIKLEILRLQGLVRKLQAELEAEREYSRALEAHIKTLQESQ
jgi:CheY-like chemotaxis protein